MFRSKRSQVFFKIIVVKKFHVKTAGFSLIKLQALRIPTVLKRDSNAGFSCTICKFFKKTLFYRLSPAAASASLRFPVCNLVKNESSAKMFFLWIVQNFEEHLLTEHLWMTASCVYLRILWSFSEHLFYKSTSGNCFISCTSCIISTTRYSKKLFRNRFSSILYKNDK